MKQLYNLCSGRWILAIGLELEQINSLIECEPSFTDGGEIWYGSGAYLAKPFSGDFENPYGDPEDAEMMEPYLKPDEFKRYNLIAPDGEILGQNMTNRGCHTFLSKKMWVQEAYCPMGELLEKANPYQEAFFHLSQPSETEMVFEASTQDYEGNIFDVEGIAPIVFRMESVA